MSSDHHDIAQHEAVMLNRAGQGDETALTELFAQYRDRLRTMVRLRLNPRLQGRVDVSDIIQEAYLEAARVLDDYLEKRPLPPFLWLRHLTAQKLVQAHRRHLGAEARTVAREISLHRGALPEATSASLAAQLLGRISSPSQAVVRAEMRTRLQEILNSMDPIDREILALRHFEQLTNAEAAQTLNLSDSAASKRYIRALERLQEVLTGVGGFSTPTG